MDVLQAQLVDQLEDSGGDGRFPDSGDGGEWPQRALVLQHDAVELRHVELVGGGPRRDGERKAVSGEDGVGQPEDEGLDRGLHGR